MSAAAAIAQRIASFLALHMPASPETAGEGGFDALLAGLTAAPAAGEAPAPGKILPVMRQSHATLEMIPDQAEVDAGSNQADATEGQLLPLPIPFLPMPIAPGDLAQPAPVAQVPTDTARLRPTETAQRTPTETAQPIPTETAAPAAVALSSPIIVPVTMSVLSPAATPQPGKAEQQRPQAIDQRLRVNPGVVPHRPVQQAAVIHAARNAEQPVALAPVAAPEAADATPAAPAPAAKIVEVGSQRPLDRSAAPTNPSGITFVVKPATDAAPAPAASHAPKAKADHSAKAVAARADTQPVALSAPSPTEPTPQPVQSAIARTTPAPGSEIIAAIGEVLPAKPRPRTPASVERTDAMPLSVPVAEVRPVAGPTAADPIWLNAERTAQIVETIEAMRVEGRTDPVSIAIDHQDFGAIEVSFDQDNDGLSVRVHAKDPEVARMIADAAPALKAAGEASGLRFERQDAGGTGTGTGTSRDTPRQGTGQDRTQQNFTHRMPSRPRDRRDGIFA